MNRNIYVETLEIKKEAGQENEENGLFPVWLLCVLFVALGIGITVETSLLILLGRVLMEMRELSVLLQYLR